jgi:hypothetical protein
VASPGFRFGAIAAAALATWLTYELTREPAVPTPPAPTTDAAPVELPRLAVDLPTLASLRATIERPLFDEDRRPDPVGDAPGAKTEADAGKPLPARLSAVVVGAGGKRSVLVELTGQDRPVLVGKGDQVGGWRVEEIEDEAVVLNAGGQRTVVPLRTFDRSPGRHVSTRPATPRRPPPKAAPPADAEAPVTDAAPAAPAGGQQAAGAKGSAAASAQRATGAKASGADRNPANRRN